MKRSILGLLVSGLALFLAAPANAQVPPSVKIGPGGAVDVNAGGTAVKTGKDGAAKVNAGGTKVNTGKHGTKVNAGGTKVHTGHGGPSIKVPGVKGPQVRAPRADARVGTFVCDGEMTKVLKGVVISAPNGPAVIAKDNCDLTIKGATLQGKRAVVVKGNASVKIIGSTLQGHEHAVLAKDNADVTIKKSTVSGKLTAKDSADIHKKGNIIR